MNLLFLTFQGDIAGSTNSIAYLAKGLARRGHRVYVGCREESLLYRMLSDTDVHAIPMTFSGRFDLGNMRQIKRTVMEYNIQLVNAQSSFDRFTSVFARWLYNLPVKVVHTRRQISRSVGGLLQRLVYVSGTHKVVAVSEGVKVSLIQQGIPENHIEVIYNGTPEEKYKKLNPKYTQQLKAKYQIKDDDIVIGCVSRLKKQCQILEALRLINESVTVLFVGVDTVPHCDGVLAEVQQKHKVIFTGQVPSDHVLDYYNLFKMKILASTIEGLSQSILEAMALGIPVIATNFAGNPEIVEDGINGLLFDDGDIRELVNNIKLLMDDEPIREKLVEKARMTALKKFNINNTLDGYETLFRKLVEN